MESMGQAAKRPGPATRSGPMVRIDGLHRFWEVFRLSLEFSSSSRRYGVAVVQLDTGSDKAGNLERVSRYIDEAASKIGRASCRERV